MSRSGPYAKIGFQVVCRVGDQASMEMAVKIAAAQDRRRFGRI